MYNRNGKWRGTLLSETPSGTFYAEPGADIRDVIAEGVQASAEQGNRLIVIEFSNVEIRMTAASDREAVYRTWRSDFESSIRKSA